MHLDVSPRRFDLQPGIPQPISITVSNTGQVIGGYAVRILGADPSWVVVDDDEISLFPDESRTVTALITVPTGMTAGERRLSVQVRELTPPEESLVEDVAFTVPEAVSAALRVDPMAITAGRTAKLSVLLDNTGNTTLHRRLHGQDPEGNVRFRFSPEVVQLGPGEHALVDVRATAKQPFLGNPLVRPLEFRLLAPDHPVAPAPAPAPAAPAEGAAKLTAPRLRSPKRTQPQLGEEVPVLANATFIQKPLVSRGPISLLGLLVAVTVFALVITVALSRIVGQSAADRNLALEIAAAREGGSSTGTSGVGGTVTLLTSGAAVPGVTVTVFAADDPEAAIATVATDASGRWAFSRLAAGDYKVTFHGAGFVQLWYPQALDPADAETVTLEAGNSRAGLDVALGGVPATISGTVSGADVSAATLTLKAPLSGMAAPTVSTTASGAAPGGTTAVAEQGATVMSVPIGDDGSFTLENVPSPSVYDLVVEKQGYATSTQRIDVSAGEERTGVEITLRQGDGVISGTVRSAAGTLPEATIVATSGQTSITTMSLTGADAGSFTLRSLPTPATFTVVVSLEEYASQTLTLSLAEGQRLVGVDVTLDASSGSLSGTVVTRADEQPASGVLVSVTDGVHTVQTATTSGDDAGSWTVSGLTVPGDYTVSFSRPDLAPQTIGVSLDGQGKLAGDDQGTTVTTDGIQVEMESATAIVRGTVRQKLRSGGSSPVGEVTVTLTSNTASFTVTTATVPSFQRGTYEIQGVPPGTYTLSISRNGVTPVSKSLELAAGSVVEGRTVLAIAASVSGVVTVNDKPVASGWIVEMYRSSEFDDNVYRTVRTDGKGKFRFDDVDAPEGYTLQVRRNDGSPATGTTGVQVLESRDVEVELKADSNDG